jgi:hypothetical protein
MEKTKESSPDDIPQSIKPQDEEKLPEVVKEALNKESEIGPDEQELFDIHNVTLTQLLTLPGIEEEVAINIKELAQDKKINSFKELESYDFVTKEQVAHWSRFFRG